MDDLTLFVWLIIGAAILSGAGFIFWIVFFVWLAKAAFRQAEKELDNLLPQLQGLLQAGIEAGRNLTPAQKAHIAQLMTRAGTQMNALNDLSRQRYDLRVSELQGMAAQAGIDWTPGSY